MAVHRSPPSAGFVVFDHADVETAKERR